MRRPCRSFPLGGFMPLRQGNRVNKESSSFLKKRTKKLLIIWAEPMRKDRSQADKSFLLLFFKKEGLA
jgi:hypothetical protein